MAAAGFTLEIESALPASRLFQAGCLDLHNVAPKAVPDLITSVQLIGGDGGVGTIKHLTFTEAVGHKYIKERVDVLDKEKFYCVTSLIEGGDLGTKVSKSVTHLKLDEKPGGGCVFKMKAEFTMIPGVDVDAYVNEEKEQAAGLFKAAEGFLLANPDAYV